ncbi:WYL domain-containing protein [Enterobacteriaceae bacterium 155047]|uniref:helix-turn-helix transcriptional regulator n=1 Tax=Huaxiibacter chinensis TaxID=2899785 RepID=UPI0021642054|nr:WYL domain-containing protein [Huaxiibacter chinensis]MCG5043884.1 WYL domain-containing protein [Huaxiibacter chinensis]
MATPVRSRSAERLVDIILELHLNGVVNRSDLMHKFNITERTVYRDLNALAPIVEHSGNGQYRLIHLSSGSHEHGIHHTLANFLNADAYIPERGKEFWQHLDARVEENHILILNTDAEHSVKKDIRQHLSAIEKSIKQHFVCQIVYKNKTRLINPYKLINKKNIWYLQATENGRLKSFSLSQIHWFDIQNKTFIPDADTLALLEKNLDPWVSDETFEVTVFLHRDISHYFKRRNLLPDQELLAETPEGITLRCQASHENQILPLLCYWLPNIQILSPQWLREKLIDTLEGYLAAVPVDA